MKRALLICAVVAGLVLADAAVKELAAAGLNGTAAVSVIPHLFNLAYVENRGCAWGMFQGQVWPLAIFGLVALGFLVWKRRTVFGLPTPGKATSAPKFALLGVFAEPLLYAGILGNVIDRLFRGFVIDMFDFHWGIHHFPCFNVADSLICIAVGLMLLASFFQESSKRS